MVVGPVICAVTTSDSPGCPLAPVPQMASFLQRVLQKVRTSQKRGAARSFAGARGVPGPSP